MNKLNQALGGPRRAACVAAVAAAALGSPAAWAADAYFTSFGASATTVTEGSWVEFSVAFSGSTGLYNYGGSDPYEPPPQAGYQEWQINWYHTYGETLSSLWLGANGESHGVSPGVAPGEGYNGSWTFLLYFPSAGSYDVTVEGSWQAMVDTYTSNESATRNCWYEDPEWPGNLVCDAWSYHYYDYSDHYSIDGTLPAQTLNITVLAVPEPETWALFLGGLGLVAGVARRR